MYWAYPRNILLDILRVNHVYPCSLARNTLHVSFCLPTKSVSPTTLPHSHTLRNNKSLVSSYDKMMCNLFK